MSHVVMIEFELAPDTLSEAEEVIRTMLEATRAFRGNVGVDVLVSDAEPCARLILERWENGEAYAAYTEFRAGPGKVTGLAGHVVSSKRLTFGIRPDL